jgi:hypothetical protein
MLTVRKTTINISGIEIDAYTADEQDKQGRPVNYLSGQGIALSINLLHTSTVQSRMSQELKTRLGAGFSTVQGKCNTTENAKNLVSKISLWTVTNAIKYWQYHGKQGNTKAQDILSALAETALDIVINDAFGKDYEKGQAQTWTKSRFAGKQTRRTWTDAVSDYINNNEVSENYRTWVYKHVSDSVNVALFGKKAKQLCEERKCDRNSLRDTHDEVSLRLIDRIEDYAMRLIDRGLEPKQAIAEAINFYK